jgi:predicted PurR-regulated permease PerM
VVWPLVIALFLATLTWPPTRFLRNHGWRPALAAGLVTLVALAIAAGTVVLIVLPVASQSDQLVSGVTDGIQNAREWAAGPPLNLGDDQVTQGIDAGVTRVQNSVGSIITATLAGVGTIVNGLVTVYFLLSRIRRGFARLRQRRL